MKTIVNINHKLGLGREGDLLVNIPEDMRFFREATLDKTVIMGRKTLLSFPGARPLKRRINIVLTRDVSLIPEESKAAADIFLSGVTAVESAAENITYRGTQGSEVGVSFEAITPSLTVLITASSKDEIFRILDIIYGEGVTDDAYIIGGASIYSLFLNDCDTLLITENDADFEADKYFPDFRSDPSWILAEAGELKEYEGIHFRFNRYERLASCRCLMLYKPKGVTVGKSVDTGFIPLAGLDKDAEGLVLLTDSAALAASFGASKAKAERTYYLELSAAADDEAIGRVRSASAATITRLSDRSFFVTVYSERYHSLRRMMRPTGLKVMSLKRVSLANVAIDPALAPGDVRPLSGDEIARLREI